MEEIVPWHTECDANYSEVDTYLPWRTQLHKGERETAQLNNDGRL